MQKKPCIGNDPFCPCQDGDSCHYEGNDPLPVPLIGGDGYDQKAVDVIKNLAMLVRRLAYKHPNQRLRGQAIDYLNGEGLQGSPLRQENTFCSLVGCKVVGPHDHRIEGPVQTFGEPK